MAESAWKIALKDELSQLHVAAAGKREAVVPMIAQLPLPTAHNEILEDLAVMESHLAGTVPSLKSLFRECVKRFVSASASRFEVIWRFKCQPPVPGFELCTCLGSYTHASVH